MRAIDYRDRPVIEAIVEQHAEEAAFLWCQRDRATDAPHYARRHLARLDERVEAHIDGLRVAGERGWEIALAQLQQRREAGEMFTVAALALGAGDAARIDAMVVVAPQKPETLYGFFGAIGWSEPSAIAATVRRWRDSAEPVERLLFLVACSLHRANPGPGLVVFLRDSDEHVRARALRLAGELGRADLVDEVAAAIDHTASEPAFWAAWSALLLGERARGVPALEAIAEADHPRRWIALEVVSRASPLEHSTQWMRRLSGDPAQRRLVTVALGHIGDPAAVPWLIARMSDPKLARVAGESFSMITGVDIAYDDLARKRPADALETPNGDPADENVEVDEDEHLPWPHSHLLTEWWQLNARRFPRGIRHILGRPVGADAIDHAWELAYQRQRRVAAVDGALMRSDIGLRNWRQRGRSLRAGLQAGTQR
jgi:uncharacterized protein (TIGR02270 family)